MNLYIKDIEHLGFKGNGVFKSNWHHFYYATSPKSKKVFVIDNVEQIIGHFKLSKKEYNDFENGKLSLIPHGCCCVTDNKYIDNPITNFRGDFRKTFKTKKNTVKFIEDLMEMT